MVEHPCPCAAVVRPWLLVRSSARCDAALYAMVRSPTAATPNQICRRRRFWLGPFVEAKISWRESAGRRKRSSYSFITMMASRRWDAVGEDAPLNRRSSEPEADKSLGKFWRRGSPVRAAARYLRDRIRSYLAGWNALPHLREKRSELA